MKGKSDICPECKSTNIGATEFKENGWVMLCNVCEKEWFEQAR